MEGNTYIRTRCLTACPETPREIKRSNKKERQGVGPIRVNCVEVQTTKKENKRV